MSSNRYKGTENLLIMQDFELFFMIPAMFFTQFSMIPAILGGLIAKKTLGLLYAFGRQNVVMEMAYEVYIIMEWKNIRQDAHLNLFLFLPFLCILICYSKPQYQDMPFLPC